MRRNPSTWNAEIYDFLLFKQRMQRAEFARNLRKPPEPPGNPSEAAPETPSEPFIMQPRKSQKSVCRHSSEYGIVFAIALNRQDQMCGLGTLAKEMFGKCKRVIDLKGERIPK